MYLRVILTVGSVSVILSVLSLFFIILDHLLLVIPLIFILQIHMAEGGSAELKTNQSTTGRLMLIYWFQNPHL